MNSNKKKVAPVAENTEIKCQFFMLSEFDSPDVPGSGINMQNQTLLLLDRARALAGIPFVINSGFRTEAHNRRVGGAANSTHLRGFAADIRCANRANFELVILALVAVGFKRFGVHHNYVHVDNDPYVPSSTWLYERSNIEQNSRLEFVRAALKMFEFMQRV